LNLKIYSRKTCLNNFYKLKFMVIFHSKVLEYFMENWVFPSLNVCEKNLCFWVIFSCFFDFGVWLWDTWNLTSLFLNVKFLIKLLKFEVSRIFHSFRKNNYEKLPIKFSYQNPKWFPSQNNLSKFPTTFTRIK
jgi:hypothetical protein